MKLYKRTNIETGKIDEVTEAEVREAFVQYFNEMDPWDKEDATEKDMLENIDYVIETLNKGEKDKELCSTFTYEFSALADHDNEACREKVEEMTRQEREES